VDWIHMREEKVLCLNVASTINSAQYVRNLLNIWVILSLSKTTVLPQSCIKSFPFISADYMLILPWIIGIRCIFREINMFALGISVCMCVCVRACAREREKRETEREVSVGVIVPTCAYAAGTQETVLGCPYFKPYYWCGNNYPTRCNRVQFI